MAEEKKEFNNSNFLDQLRLINDEDKISLDEISDIGVGNCPICYETLRPMIYENDTFKANPNITTTPCGHTFCYTCLSTHLDTKNKCPLCRKKIVNKFRCRYISNYEACWLINQKIDYHLTNKINIINLAGQQLNDPNILISTVKYCMYDFMQSIRQLQLIDNSDDEENDDL